MSGVFKKALVVLPILLVLVFCLSALAWKVYLKFDDVVETDETKIGGYISVEEITELKLSRSNDDPTKGSIKLKLEYTGDGEIKVWDNSAKQGNPILQNNEDSKIWTPSGIGIEGVDWPRILWVEGITLSNPAKDIKLTLTWVDDPVDEPDPTDTVLLTVIEESLVLLDMNGEAGAVDHDDEGPPPNTLYVGAIEDGKGDVRFQIEKFVGGTEYKWSIKDSQGNHKRPEPPPGEEPEPGDLQSGWNVENNLDPGDYYLEVKWDNGNHERKVNFTVVKGDLDIVHFQDDNEHVPDAQEENGSKGACLSLDRGAGHRRPILIRALVPGTITTGQVKLAWSSSKIKLYDGENEINSGQTYNLNDLPKRLYVDATAVSGSKGDEKVTLSYVPGGQDAVPLDKIGLTNFALTITVREGSGGNTTFSPEAENDRRDEVVAFLGGLDILGKLDYKRYGGGDYWYGGSVEIVGQLTPNTLRASDFWADEFYWRQNKSVRIWVNDTRTFKVDDDPDDPAAGFQDRTPSNTAKIYYVDAPATSPPPILGDIKARRDKFEAWCTFGFHDKPANSKYQPCSDGNKFYYNRMTVRQTSTGGHVKDKRDDESCTNGNVFGNAAQTLNYDLKAPVVTSITPNSGQRGTVVTITNLAGQVFVKTPTVELLKGGDKITAADVDVVVKSKNKIECKFSIPADAALGDWNVRVTNPAVDDDADGTKEPAKSSNTDITFEVTD